MDMHMYSTRVIFIQKTTSNPLDDDSDEELDDGEYVFTAIPKPIIQIDTAQTQPQTRSPKQASATTSTTPKHSHPPPSRPLASSSSTSLLTIPSVPSPTYKAVATDGKTRKLSVHGKQQQ